jgi:uncharacterized glyoxalase superfamily protein PhnB
VIPYAADQHGRFGPAPVDNRTMPAAVVIPQLVYDDVSEAVGWLCDTFGFVERWRAGDHRAQLEVPTGGCVVVTEPRTSYALRGQWSVMVRVSDVDAHHEHAAARGAKILDPPKDFPYDERHYEAEDLAGHHWDFTQSIADLAPQDWGGTAGPALRDSGGRSSEPRNADRVVDPHVARLEPERRIAAAGLDRAHDAVIRKP